MTAVADRMLLRDLVDAYAQAADRADGERLAGLFTDDGTLTIYARPGRTEPTAVRRGRAELSAAIATLSRYRATCHVVASHGAEVLADGRARGETRCVAHHVSGEPGAERDRVLYIRYDDEFARRDGRWLFSTRALWVEFVEERPLTQP